MNAITTNRAAFCLLFFCVIVCAQISCNYNHWSALPFFSVCWPCCEVIKMSESRKYFTAGSKRHNKQISLPDSSSFSTECLILEWIKKILNSLLIFKFTEEVSHRDGCYSRQTVVLVDDVIKLLIREIYFHENFYLRNFRKLTYATISPYWVFIRYFTTHHDIQ